MYEETIGYVFWKYSLEKSFLEPFHYTALLISDTKELEEFFRQSSSIW